MALGVIFYCGMAEVVAVDEETHGFILIVYEKVAIL